ncbi:DUF6765 family protein [Marinomonas sp. THO17]|uniref:DUF6765 family protein n=1 Tax=Marinomonas sp. THO17 TaxID=3149048 RepID=UPI00336C03F3
MEWRFYYEDGTDSGWHKNPQTYLEFAEKIHRYFTSIANNNPDLADFTQYQDWQQLAPKVSSILNKQGKKQQRIKAWQEAAKVDGFFISPRNHSSISRLE